MLEPRKRTALDGKFGGVYSIQKRWNGVLVLHLKV